MARLILPCGDGSNQTRVVSSHTIPTKRHTSERTGSVNLHFSICSDFIGASSQVSIAGRFSVDPELDYVRSESVVDSYSFRMPGIPFQDDPIVCQETEERSIVTL